MKITEFNTSLTALGFGLLDDNKKLLMEKIKNTIIKQVYYNEEEDNKNFSEIP